MIGILKNDGFLSIILFFYLDQNSMFTIYNF
nr:MAG TPA: hypothetical protein [Caudoviricetes sp.]